MGTEKIGTVRNNKRCPKPAAAAVGQAAFCLERTRAAAAWAANPAQNEQALLLGTAPILSLDTHFGRPEGS
eukprot:2991274-Pyramimonas_sp.AAC.1